MSIDRRKAERYSRKFQVIVHSPYREGGIYTINISTTGTAICHSQRYYGINSILQLEILISEDYTIRCDAKTVWITPKSKNASAFKLGLEFIDLDKYDKERLSACITGNTL